MRVAVVSWSGRAAGGVETYLEAVLRGLGAGGHEVALWHEVDAPRDRRMIPIPDGGSRWCAAALGAERAVAALRSWAPNLLYVHGLADPGLEARLLDVAPAVFFAHQYHGTCISGAKRFQQPSVRPCARVFGWGCFLHYYPHRCGGLNPVTMVESYARQASRLGLLGRYRSIVTFSEHMREEYLRHGFAPSRVVKVPYPVASLFRAAAATPVTALTGAGDAWRLAFVGRMETPKGGDMLLASLPAVRARAGRPIRVTLVGDGGERRAWEERARRLHDRMRDVDIEFTGWLDAEGVRQVLARTHLLVVPSVWPEPFGIVGPEAGAAGVPAAAFAVGGIPEWLRDGVNGCLAPGERPTPAGLADAIVRCLSDPAIYERLRAGASRAADRFTMERHLAALLETFDEGLRR